MLRLGATVLTKTTVGPDFAGMCCDNVCYILSIVGKGRRLERFRPASKHILLAYS